MKDVFDLTHFEAQWKTIFAGRRSVFQPAPVAPRRRLPSGRRTGARRCTPAIRCSITTEIKRILVVKLDHIGDFVTAMPAIRRLKADLFPAASIHVLASRASRAFVRDRELHRRIHRVRILPRRSGLGRTEHERGRLRGAARRSCGRIASTSRSICASILDTRDVLQYTPARFLAGYDYHGAVSRSRHRAGLGRRPDAAAQAQPYHRSI